MAGLISVRQATSDFYAQTVSLQIESWSRPGHKFRGDELQQAIGNLERSLSITPASAWSLQQMGALQFARMRGATVAQVAVDAARDGYRDYKAAIMQRPTSPFIWVEIAMAKQALGEIDAEFFDALARSAQLGPWEPEVQLNGLTAGLAAWDRADAAQRVMILAMRDRAVRHNAQKVNEIARQFGRADLLCDRKAEPSPGGNPCPRAGS